MLERMWLTEKEKQVLVGTMLHSLRNYRKLTPDNVSTSLQNPLTTDDIEQIESGQCSLEHTRLKTYLRAMGFSDIKGLFRTVLSTREISSCISDGGENNLGSGCSVDPFFSSTEPVLHFPKGLPSIERMILTLVNPEGTLKTRAVVKALGFPESSGYRIIGPIEEHPDRPSAAFPDEIIRNFAITRCGMPEDECNPHIYIAAAYFDRVFSSGKALLR